MLATTTSNVPPRGEAVGKHEGRRRRHSPPRSRARRPPPADRRPRRRRGSRRASPRRSRECRSRIRSRAPTLHGRSSRTSHSRQSRVVGCEPVPNASPGSSVTLIAEGSGAAHHDGTIQRRSWMCRARTAPASRAPSPARQRRASRAAGDANPSAAPASASARAASAAAGNSAVTRRGRPTRIGRHAGLAVERDLAAVPASAIRDVDRRGAGVEKRVAPGVGRAGVGIETQRDIVGGHPRGHSGQALVTRRARQRRRRVSPRACASRAFPRDSGSTCRRAGTCRPAEAPGAAECWS